MVFELGLKCSIGGNGRRESNMSKGLETQRVCVCVNFEMALGQTVKILLKNKTKFKKNIKSSREKYSETMKRQAMKYK